MINARIIYLFLALPFLLGMSLQERRVENEKIQLIIKKTQEVNQRPSFRDSPRAARTATNRYRNQLPPILPKTIYREVLPTGRFARFAGGIPR